MHIWLRRLGNNKKMKSSWGWAVNNTIFCLIPQASEPIMNFNGLPNHPPPNFKRSFPQIHPSGWIFQWTHFNLAHSHNRKVNLDKVYHRWLHPYSFSGSCFAMFEHTVLLILLSVKLLLFEERVTRTWSIEHKHARLKIPRGGGGGGGGGWGGALKGSLCRGVPPMPATPTLFKTKPSHFASRV